jgi:hypothetical protein
MDRRAALALLIVITIWEYDLASRNPANFEQGLHAAHFHLAASMR